MPFLLYKRYYPKYRHYQLVTGGQAYQQSELHTKGPGIGAVY